MPSALRLAIEQGDLIAVQAALAAGADVEEADIHGIPGLPLRLASFRGHADIVRELLRYGADMHAANADGPDAPLRMAVRGKHQAVVELLLGTGADIPADLHLPQFHTHERRLRGERRGADNGPPHGLRERRQDGQRRSTSVQEVRLSSQQWEHLFSRPGLAGSGA